MAGGGGRNELNFSLGIRRRRWANYLSYSFGSSSINAAPFLLQALRRLKVTWCYYYTALPFLFLSPQSVEALKG